MRLLYLSRGRGFGHAVVDIQIALWLRERFPRLDIVFASYGDGASLISNSVFEFSRLQITEDSEMQAQIVIPEIHRVIDLLSPQIILSDEVFLAPPAAKFRSIPCILLTHWFFSELGLDTPLYRSLDSLMCMAEKVLLLDMEPFHKVPAPLRSKVKFIGPIIRDSFVPYIDAKPDWEPEFDVVITMGGKTRAFIREIQKILDALFVLSEQGKELNTMLVVPGMREYFEAYVRAKGMNSVVVRDFVSDIAALVHSARLTVGRGSYTTLAELATLGKPSLHLLADGNPVDEFHVLNFATLGTIQWERASRINVASTAQLIWSSFMWAQQNQTNVMEAGSIYRRCNSRLEIETVFDDILSDIGFSD